VHGDVNQCPVEEYLRTTDRPDMEYVDGELVERHVVEHKHSRLQALIAGLFLSLARTCRVCVMALPYRSEPVLATHPI